MSMHAKMAAMAVIFTANREEGRKNHIGLWVFVLLLSLLTGLLVAVLPYQLILAIPVIPIFVTLLIWRFEYGLLFVLACASGVVGSAYLPKVAFLSAADITLMMICGLLAITDHKLFKNYRESEIGIWISYSVFLILLVISAVYAHVLRGVPLKDVLGEGRDFLFLLIFPALVMVLDNQEAIHRFVVGLVVLAIVFALGQIMQGIFHIPVFGGSGRLETLQTLASKSYGTTRTLTRGINIMVFTVFLAAGWYILKRIKMASFLSIAALLGVGILLTFGRTTWGVTVIGVSIVVQLLGLSRSWPLLMLSLVGSVILILVLIAVKPTILDAVVNRATSVNREIQSGGSAKWRYYEAQVALPQVAANPVLGLGLGATYRSRASSDVVPEQVRYIHDGYIYMSTKLGIPALCMFIGFLSGIFWNSLKGARHEKNIELRAIHAAICAGVVDILVSSITEPHIMLDSGLSYIAIIAGCSVAIARINNHESLKLG